MTKYLDKSFSVTMPEGSDYRDRWDATFKKTLVATDQEVAEISKRITRDHLDLIRGLSRESRPPEDSVGAKAIAPLLAIIDELDEATPNASVTMTPYGHERGIALVRKWTERIGCTAPEDLENVLLSFGSAVTHEVNGHAVRCLVATPVQESTPTPGDPQAIFDQGHAAGYGARVIDEELERRAAPSSCVTLTLDEAKALRAVVMGDARLRAALEEILAACHPLDDDPCPYCHYPYGYKFASNGVHPDRCPVVIADEALHVVAQSESAKLWNEPLSEDD